MPQKVAQTREPGNVGAATPHYAGGDHRPGGGALRAHSRTRACARSCRPGPAPARLRHGGRADRRGVGRAIKMLTATGQITDERRQEFILWSDTMGVSMLVDAMAHRAPAGATESTVLGPFYVPARRCASSARTSPSRRPAAAWVDGRVLRPDGTPIAGAELDVWQNGDNRSTPCRTPRLPEDHLRGRFRTRDEGALRVPAPCARCPTRSPTTGRWARCSPRPDGTPGARPTST